MERMRRTQIYLDRELDDALLRLARKHRTSKASLIRQAARRFLQQEQGFQEDPVWGLVGLGKGGPGRASEEHDRILAESDLGTRGP